MYVLGDNSPPYSAINSAKLRELLCLLPHSLCSAAIRLRYTIRISRTHRVSPNAASLFFWTLREPLFIIHVEREIRSKSMEALAPIAPIPSNDDI